MKRFNETYGKRQFLSRNEWADTYKAIHSESEEKVIVKVLVNKSTDEEYINNLSKEVKIIKEIKNPNLIHINNMFQYSACGKTYYYIESEYFEGLNLKELKESIYLDKVKSLEIIREVIKGIKEFNDREINYGILKEENIFVMDETRALSQRIRPLKLIIVNIMPTKIVTETQLLRLLSNTPLQIEVDWLCMESHNSKNTSQEHLMEFYKTFNEIKDNKYDGLIVTGAPVEKLKFEDVDYWNELTNIFDWANTNVFSSFFICWASQASLYYYYGVEKYQLKEKLTGVYHHHTNPEKMRRRILRGFDYQFYAPHSRYTAVKKEDIEKIDSLDILASSNDAGVYLVAEKDGSRFFVTGHPEYDPDTLDKEYHRDLAKGGDCVMPKNYYKNDDVNDEILVKWRSHAYLLFSNWLNYYVYQNTPYNLDDLLKMKTTNK